jgi:3-(3-hydroxy-phenyl)propionate hydroxylase/monooxygenase
MRAGTPVLLDLADDPGVAKAVAQWPGAARVTHVAGSCKEEPDLAGLLIRPDGYTAWAADRDADPARVADELGAALRTWFGAN